VPAGAGAGTRVTVTIVVSFFFCVAQYFVSFGRFLEFFFSFLVSLIFIRMKLNGYLAVGLFYFFRAGGF
jgi:hypothetical protein